MKILSIETSCDESALSIIEAKGGLEKPSFNILANNVASQINIHRQYGGVFPMMAKREHCKNLIPLLKKTLTESKLINYKSQILSPKEIKNLNKILERESDLLEQILKFIPTIKKPKIDAIAVTHGPGLEPALWVGVNLAKVLSFIWDIPVIPVNHMNGHILSVFAQENKFSIKNIEFPVLSLLVSGGHTELVLTNDLLKFKKIGETLDDAAGEAFDKVARLLGLPYPGGPEISRLAEQSRRLLHSQGSSQARGDLLLQTSAQRDGASKAKIQQNFMRGLQEQIPSDEIKLPRPMLHTKNFDFSFSGLKTAVLYLTQKIGDLTPEIKKEIAREFEDAVVDVLTLKTQRALEKYKVKTLIVAGGVAANKHLKKTFENKIGKDITLLFPTRDLATDNSIMIAIAGYFKLLKNPKLMKATANIKLKAQGNLEIK